MHNNQENRVITATDASAIVHCHLRDNSFSNEFTQFTGKVFEPVDCYNYWSVRVRHWRMTTTEFVVDKKSGKITHAYELSILRERVRRDRSVEPAHETQQ